MPFVACGIYKNDIFALDINDNIWRFELEYVDQQILIRKCLGDETEYFSIFKLLKAKRDLYR